MWGENEDSFKSVTRVNVRPARNVRVDLTLLVMGDSFLGWIRQSEIAVRSPNLFT